MSSLVATELLLSRLSSEVVSLPRSGLFSLVAELPFRFAARKLLKGDIK